VDPRGTGKTTGWILEATLTNGRECWAKTIGGTPYYLSWNTASWIINVNKGGGGGTFEWAGPSAASPNGTYIPGGTATGILTISGAQAGQDLATLRAAPRSWSLTYTY
jgi:hypothetical protein